MQVGGAAKWIMSNQRWDAGVLGLRSGVGESVATCQLPKEGREKAHGHLSRTLCGVRSGRKAGGVYYGQRHPWPAVHSPLRRQLVGRRCAVLRRPSDGSRLHDVVREVVLPSVGHGEPLAHLGPASSRKERVQGTRLVAVAVNRPPVRA